LVWILGVLWVLGELDIDYAPFLVAAGGISLAIGFGAQSLVKDMVSGFFILMEEQFALGDSVAIGGESGTVEKISLRTIKFRSLDGTLHTIPTGSISLVSNKTYQWSRAVVKVGVSYDDDPQKVLSVLKTMCQEIADDPNWKESLIDEPTAQGILSFGDSTVNFRVLAKTPPGKQWGVERELHIRIKKAFDREGIEIPYNIVNVLERKETT
jgi:small conductance mechanosensitive channel